MIERRNRNQQFENKTRMQDVKDELNSFFNGKKGETVYFKFNILMAQVDDTNNGDGNINRRNYDNRLISSEMNEDGNAKFVPAVTFTTKSPHTRGFNIGSRVMIRDDQSIGNGALSHEIGHSLLSRDNQHTIRGLMSLFPSRITPKEIQMILEDSYER